MKTSSKIDNREIEIITAHVTAKPREFLVAHPEYKLSKVAKWKITRLIKKRESGVPLAYLLGEKEFFGLDFKVNKHTLIPRPDTELMVETILHHLTTSPPDHTTLIDVGTGTGCIPIAILDRIRKSGLSVIRNSYAIDISNKALRIAKKNAKTHNVNIKFLHGNLLSPFLKNQKLIAYSQKLIITANLPYLTEEQFANEASIRHEPKSALVAENKGLALYEELLKQIQSLLSTSDFKLSTYLEIDPDQAEPIIPLIKKYLPKADIQIKKDLSGLDRVVIIEA